MRDGTNLRWPFDARRSDNSRTRFGDWILLKIIPLVYYRQGSYRTIGLWRVTNGGSHIVPIAHQIREWGRKPRWRFTRDYTHNITSKGRTL